MSNISHGTATKMIKFVSYPTHDRSQKMKPLDFLRQFKPCSLEGDRGEKPSRGLLTLHIMIEKTEVELK